MIQLTSAALSHPGLLRQENEDCVWSQIFAPPGQQPTGLFIVCDGMGGHMGGKYASYWAVEAVRREFSDLFVEKDPRATLVLTDEDIQKARSGELVVPKHPDEPDLEELTQRAIGKANQVVYDFASYKPEMAANAGTTITMAAIRGRQAVVANAGDSRTYIIRRGRIRQISRDHSLVATLVSDGQILPNEIFIHPQRNVIYRFLGQKGMPQADLFIETLQPGDWLLLCSDGLWEMVQDDKRMLRLTKSAAGPEAACQALIDAANQAGGEDNISVVLVKVS